ncbi:MAG: hypothetical protein FD181_3273 [Prolixibacteraceae bacterium]|nr:MAG: hypothetical protein FD181_3273 [Prolixibacteraceae bacterium]
MNIKLKLICVLLLAIVSCNTDDLLLEPQSLVKSAEKIDIYVESGILNIKDESVFWKLVELNTKKTFDELKSWQDSLGFESFYSIYESIFSKYEIIVEGKNPIVELEQFRNDYKDFITMATGTYDGLPDYSIKPVIDMLYASVANANGLVKIGGKLIDAKSISRLKSVDSCYKSTSTRRMWIDINRFTNGNIANAYVTHQKKVLFAWVSYKTQYYWELENPPFGYWYTPGDVSSGYTIVMPTGGTVYLRMWNRGVGESNSCTFVN